MITRYPFHCFLLNTWHCFFRYLLLFYNLTPYLLTCYENLNRNQGNGSYSHGYEWEMVETLIRVHWIFKPNLPYTGAKARTRWLYCMHYAGVPFYNPKTDVTIWREASFVWIGIEMCYWPAGVRLLYGAALKNCFV